MSDFLVVEMEGSDYRENYLYKDFLGSTVATADQSGAVIENLDYDPFGQRRNTSNLSWLDGFKPKTTSRGFTGHDHADSVNLIHMKGRMYDPEIGLFLSPDSYVQDPGLVQNLNRYSYVLNNPLSYTDPSGHFFKHAFRELNRGINSAGRALANPGRFLESTWKKSYRATNDPRYQRLAASVAISVLATIYAPTSASSAWYQTAAYYAAVGYTSSYVATNGDKKAALNGAVAGAAFNMVGSYFEYAKEGGQLSTGMMAGKVAAHGMVGGLSAVANGGKFESGFLSAGLSEAAGQQGLYGDDNAKGWQIAQSAATAAVVGGTISELSGGSFEEAALTAAMGRLFNAVAHALPEPGLEDGTPVIGEFVDWLGDKIEKNLFGEGSCISAGNTTVCPTLVGGTVKNVAGLMLRTESAAQGAILAKHLALTAEYGSAGVKFLENGRIRYYGNIKLSRTPGEMSGARLVRELDGITGRTRAWIETLDHVGNVRSVAPKPVLQSQNHLIFDSSGKYMGRR